jgi:hypothetical protein
VDVDYNRSSVKCSASGPQAHSQERLDVLT